MEDYHINIFYSDEDEGYIADIPDLEACSAFGNTAEDALRASGFGLRVQVAVRNNSQVEQGAYRILPALRSGSAVLRWSVMLLRLRCLAALSITPLPLCVGQSHGHCAPLRNGAGGAAAV